MCKNRLEYIVLGVLFVITGDAAFIKKINRSLIIREIVSKGMISRAELAKAVNLTRATISAQVADLIDEHLIIETHLEHNAVGRKPIMLSINKEAGYALGIDLDHDHISFALSNLLGEIISSHEIELHSKDYEHVLNLLIEHIKDYEMQLDDSVFGIVGICVAVHGLVNNEQIIHYIPHLDWDHVNLQEDLSKHFPYNIYIENNANLSAFAERNFTHHDTDHLLSATFYSGIGLGMIMNNEFFRGHDGFAGEVGHMIMMPGGLPCKCGNKGCWELYASDLITMKQIGDLKGAPHLSYEQVKDWVQAGDEEVLTLLDKFIYYVSIGLNNMINMYNPEAIVLDSELLRILPQANEKIKQHLNSKINHYRELSISIIGRKSSILGACSLVILKFLDVPVLNLPYEIEH